MEPITSSAALAANKEEFFSTLLRERGPKKTAAQFKREQRTAKRANGFVLVQLWVKPQHRQRLKEFMQGLEKGTACDTRVGTKEHALLQLIKQHHRVEQYQLSRFRTTLTLLERSNERRFTKLCQEITQEGEKE